MGTLHPPHPCSYPSKAADIRIYFLPLGLESLSFPKLIELVVFRWRFLAIRAFFSCLARFSALMLVVRTSFCAPSTSIMLSRGNDTSQPGSLLLLLLLNFLDPCFSCGSTIAPRSQKAAPVVHFDRIPTYLRRDPEDGRTDHRLQWDRMVRACEFCSKARMRDRVKKESTNRLRPMSSLSATLSAWRLQLGRILAGAKMEYHHEPYHPPVPSPFLNVAALAAMQALAILPIGARYGHSQQVQRLSP